jgi:hypothetical protein
MCPKIRYDEEYDEESTVISQNILELNRTKGNQIEQWLRTSNPLCTAGDATYIPQDEKK